MKLFSSSIHSQAQRMFVGAVFMIFLGVRGILTSEPAENLEKISGKVERIVYGLVKTRDNVNSESGIIIVIDKNNYGTWVSKHIHIIENKLKVNDNVEILLGKEYGQIVQLKVNGELIFEYKRFGYLLPPFFFLLIGGLIFIFLLRIIIKHPELISAHIARSKGVNLDE